MLKQLALDCESARLEFDTARALPRTERRIDGKRVNAASTRLIAAWKAYDRAQKAVK